MTRPATNSTRRKGAVRCAIYTRKSSEEGLEQEFNSLLAQREACEAFITSQRHEGWVCLRAGYDDGGFSGATNIGHSLEIIDAIVWAQPTSANRPKLLIKRTWRSLEVARRWIEKRGRDNVCGAIARQCHPFCLHNPSAYGIGRPI
jgi:hypothetical protein